MKQIADPDFDAKVAHPTFTKKYPKLMFDVAHHNESWVEGRFKGLTDLLTNDGYKITNNKKKFTKETLTGFRSSYHHACECNAKTGDEICF